MTYDEMIEKAARDNIIPIVWASLQEATRENYRNIARRFAAHFGLAPDMVIVPREFLHRLQYTVEKQSLTDAEKVSDVRNMIAAWENRNDMVIVPREPTGAMIDA